MSSHESSESTYEIYTHTLTEMRDLLIDLKNKDEDIQWREKAEALEKELNSLKKNKNYGLFWKEKREEFDTKTKDSLPVLTELTDLAITQDATPAHVIIEGDNYHILSVLSYTHQGQVDVIYIDPPYNTGNKDFIYNDHYVDREDSFRHSKWLSFMEKRLKLARDLLKDTGVIFISIDDNEQAQLKLLCDEIFGEIGFIGVFIWKKKKKGSHLSSTFRSMTEYVLAYTRNISDLTLFGEDAYAEKQQPLAKRTNSIKTLFFPIGTVVTKLESLTYKKGRKGEGSSSLNFLNDFEVRDGMIITDLYVEGPFVWVQKMLESEFRLGTQVYLSKKFGFNVLRNNQSEKIKTPSSFLDSFLGVGTNEDARQELIDILGEESLFDYPKPVSLIKYLIETKTHFHKDGTILDFFAGSGTTGHAVLALNQEDGGNRRFILCSNREDTTEFPDKNICRDITYERVKRVATGYTNTKGVDVAGLGGNIRYLQAEFIPKHQGTDNIRNRMVERCSEMLCLRENIWESMPDISTREMRFYQRGDRYLAILFGLFCFEEFSDILRSLDRPISIYVFSRGQMTRDDFEGITVAYTVEEIPDPILAIYQIIFGL